MHARAAALSAAIAAAVTASGMSLYKATVAPESLRSNNASWKSVTMIFVGASELEVPMFRRLMVMLLPCVFTPLCADCGTFSVS